MLIYYDFLFSNEMGTDANVLNLYVWIHIFRLKKKEMMSSKSETVRFILSFYTVKVSGIKTNNQT